ncbi:MAG: NUDIX domain-containing protein [Ruminococcaceae bacterium]|nr:NUDIX domain-containing protein [Oscillospiraceae bacterium]
MTFEKSCGALVIRHDAQTGNDYILMIRHRPGGYRSFPKGHVEPGETERETAMREVMEETSVRITLIPDFRHVVCYTPAPAVEKEVVYFLARTEQVDIRPRRGEIAQVEWIPLLQAERYLTHENDKRVLNAARDKLNALAGN